MQCLYPVVDYYMKQRIMTATATDDEQALAQQVVQGDARAMRLLYERFVPNLASVCTRYVADDDDVKDVLQDSFVAIFTSMDKFQYKGPGSLRAWMTRIVANKAINSLKKAQRLSSIEVGGQQIPDVPDEEVEAEKVPIDVLHRMIRQLPDGYRTVFNMSVIDHRSHIEIAEALGIKRETSASQLHHAKALLAKKIKEYLKTHDN